MSIKQTLKLNFLPQTQRLLLLCGPLMSTRILDAIKDFLNIYMLAQLGPAKIAAGGLITIFFATLMMIFWGIFAATSSVVAQYHGAQKPALVGQAVKNALWLCVILSLPIMMLIWFGAEILSWFGQPAETITAARAYCHVLTWAVLPDFLGMVLAHFFIGISKPRVQFFSSLIYFPFNILVSYTFVFGKFGMPALGIVGIGVGTVATHVMATLIMGGILFFNQHYRQYLRLAAGFQWTFIKELLQVGLPVGFMWAIEVSFFLVINLFIGKLGTFSLAAHQIVGQFESFAFTIIYALTIAVSVQVGQAIGNKRPIDALYSGYAGLVIAMIYMTIIAIIYCFFPDSIIRLDLDMSKPENQQVSHIANKIFLAAAVYQIFDVARFVMFGALRGIKDTKFPMYTSMIGFWVIALPLGYLMVFYWHWFGAEGFWWAMAIGVFVSFILQLRRFNKKMHQQIAAA